MFEKLPEAVGEALEGVRAGLDQTVFHAVDLRQGMAALKLTSLAFVDHAPIPERYTADGVGLSPPLAWSGVPPQADQLVLVVEDADSPTPQPLVHAIAVLAAAGDPDGALAEGALGGPDAEPGDGDRAAAADARTAPPEMALGLNSFLRHRWLPPDPPPGHGVHRYLFQIFALAASDLDGLDDGEDRLPEHPGRDAVRQAILRRGLASGCLVGTHERPSTRTPTSDGERVDRVEPPSFGPTPGVAA